MRRALTAALVSVAACTCAPPSPDAGLVAVIEDGNALRLERRNATAWTTVRELPLDARALRVSPNGRSVAFVRDARDGARIEILAYAWPDGQEKPGTLGATGFREHEAFGLAINDAGRTVHLAPDGTLVDSAEHDELDPRKGSYPIFVDADHWAYTDEIGCADKACGPALRMLVGTAGRRVWRTNAELILEGDRRVPMTDVLDADARVDGTVLVVRRATYDGHPEDELVVVAPTATHIVLHAPIVISARWDRDNSIVAVIHDTPVDVYESVLAHAPDEYEGERASGEAFRVDPASGARAHIDGLSGTRVRALVPQH